MRDPAMLTEVFLVRQEYNNLNNANPMVTNPQGFNIIRDFCKKVKQMCEAAGAQKRGAADVAAALDIRLPEAFCLCIHHKMTSNRKPPFLISRIRSRTGIIQSILRNLDSSVNAMLRLRFTLPKSNGNGDYNED